MIARPTCTVDPIAIVVLPSCVQVVPFTEYDPVNVFPLRTSLTQYGAVGPAALLLDVAPPVAERYCHVTPLVGVRPMNASAEFAFSVERIITPAFDQALMWSSSDATRAMMVQLPVTGT